MQNELVKLPQAEMLEMAKLFIDSKMFPDMTAVGMAFVKIQAGKEIGISPFAAMSGIHIIKGKATIGAGLMAGCVKGSGKYDYKVVKMDESVCSIDFFQGAKNIGNSTFTIAEARKAGTQNLEKFPKNMLFARAMSNGVKWFCPDVFTMPVYTPEEMGDPNFTEDIGHEEAPSTGGAAVTPEVVKKKAISPKTFDAAIAKIEALPETDRPAAVTTMIDTYQLDADQLARLKPFEAVSITQPAA